MIAWIVIGVAAVLAAAAYLAAHGFFGRHPGDRQLGRAPRLDPESALLIRQAERESMGRLRGEQRPLLPMPEGQTLAALVSEMHSINPTPTEGGPPWPVS